LLTRGALRHRIASGRLHRLHRGIYAVGHGHVSGHGRWMAAVLACGPDAVLSHRSAAALWSLAGAAGSRVDVSVPGRTRQGHEGISLHNVRALRDQELTKHEGIPVTTVARTLLDLAEVVPQRQLVRAFEAAERLRLLDMRELVAVRDRNPGRRGLRALTALIDDHHAVRETRSELERRFVDFCRDAGLPQPVMNTAVAGFEVDVLWPDRRLVVELDGYSFHRSRRAFEGDRVRDAQLQLAGYRVVRITSRRLAEERSAVAGTIRELLRCG
jgi:very-short-patch-repair endonuclease